MIIAIPKEIRENETRVAATPEVVKKMSGWGFTIQIEKSAGEKSGFSDTDYQTAGANICATAKETYHNADIILKIWGPQTSEAKYLTKDMSVIANFQALPQSYIELLAQTGIQAFALEKMPRISRAQSMDILSSQSSLAGYKAVINAVHTIDIAIPMMTTSAGSIPPAKVLVLGVGVAGLQAIATAKRLGAQVYASDIRPETKEQTESLGAKFVESQDLSQQLSQTNIAITTALSAGKKSPVLITKEALSQMPPGAVIIDIAGNVEGFADGATTQINGIKIIGNTNLAAELPASASKLFANNIFNFLSSQFNQEQHQIIFNFADEIIDKTCICKEGKTR